MTHNEDALLPCPFCGGEADVKEDFFREGLWGVLCDTDYCEGSAFNPRTGKENAIKAWNTRAALNHEDVDLESIRSHETDYHKFPINKGWNDCLEYLKRYHKGEVIK